MIIDNFNITKEGMPFIVAEIGHNHQGNLQMCKDMFRVAKMCGANAVKLQKRDNKTLFTKAYYNKPYDNPFSYAPNGNRTYGAHREALEFNFPQYVELKKYAHEIGITFFATAFDIPSADFLKALDMPAYKIASALYTDIPLIQYVAKFDKPMIISIPITAKSKDIDRILEVVCKDVVLLHCVPSYPTKALEINLVRMVTLKEWYPDLLIGISDHYSGIQSAVKAHEWGARVIEKHFTLDRAMKGTDQGFSLSPYGFAEMISHIKESMLMEEGVIDNEAIKKALIKMGKSIWPIRYIKKGDIITNEDVRPMTPAYEGLPPYEVENIIGKVAVCDCSTSEPLTWDKLNEN